MRWTATPDTSVRFRTAPPICAILSPLEYINLAALNCIKRRASVVLICDLMRARDRTAARETFASELPTNLAQLI